jgi:hypothetical protein
MQNKDHKADIALVYARYQKVKKIDYIACWFLKAGEYIRSSNAQFSFVSTNSMCQGEQIPLLWPFVLREDLEIFFAHQSFKWINSAKGNAGVTCVVVGIRNKNSRPKYIYDSGVKKEVNCINAYLTGASDIFIDRQSSPIADFPKMHYGNMAIDGGNLIFSSAEKTSLLNEFPQAEILIRRVIGAQEFIKGIERWCLWISDENLKLAQSILPIRKRIELSKEFRGESSDAGTHKLASKPHQFREMKCAKQCALLIPTVTSERREYIPIGFVGIKDVIIAPNNAIYDPDAFLFGLLSSKMHMTWVKAVAGRLETRIRYSSVLCYNTFPVPNLTKDQKQTLTMHVAEVLEEREKHTQKTITQLYDPDKMPKGLREAHHNLDLAVDRIYRTKPFTSDEERLEHLFKLYEEMTAKEKLV